MSIQEILDEFIEIKNDAQLSIKYAVNINISRDKISNSIKEMIINNAFMRVITAWEQFLEKSVFAYSLLEISLKGNSPKCYIMPIDEAHANEIIKGVSQYFDWSNKECIINMAERIFENGEPYKSVINRINSILLNIKKLRNNIAHNSYKSNAEFNTLVRNELSPSEVGISTAQFLLSSKNGNSPFWEIYFQHLYNSATIIANF